MTDPPDERSSLQNRALWFMALGLVVGIGLAAGLGVLRWANVLGESHTRINQSAVVDRLQSVAKLVTTEAMLRDIVTYENTYLGSTKRSLVIVTGKALVGIDLAQQPDVSIDQSARHISIGLPHAQLVGLDILDLKTYDESRGLWNPFHPGDRDTIFQLAREHLVNTARELSVLRHAEDGARRVLAGLFAAEGYEVEVRFGR